MTRRIIDFFSKGIQMIRGRAVRGRAGRTGTAGKAAELRARPDRVDLRPGHGDWRLSSGQRGVLRMVLAPVGLRLLPDGQRTRWVGLGQAAAQIRLNIPAGTAPASIPASRESMVSIRARSSFDIGELLGDFAIPDPEQVNASHVPAVEAVPPALHDSVSGLEGLLVLEAGAGVFEDRSSMPPGWHRRRRIGCRLVAGRWRQRRSRR